MPMKIRRKMGRRGTCRMPPENLRRFRLPTAAECPVLSLGAPCSTVLCSLHRVLPPEVRRLESALEARCLMPPRGNRPATPRDASRCCEAAGYAGRSPHPDVGVLGPEQIVGAPGDQSDRSKGIWRQGIGSFIRNSYVSTLRPVVICPYSCPSEETPRRQTRGAPPADSTLVFCRHGS